MGHEDASENRRRHVRIPVGLPVQIHLGVARAPITVELVDLAAGGVRFRFATEERQARLDERAHFTFVLPGQEACRAEGRVVRVDAGGEFIVVLEQANDSFRDFVVSLAP